MGTASRDHGWRTWAAVAVGGFAGTELRYGLGLAFPEDPAGFPWTTLTINVAGSFALGILTTLWIARPQTAFWLRAGIGPGILGSFTTFSAVVFSVERLSGLGNVFLAALYLIVSILLGLAAAGLGWRLGKSLADRIGHNMADKDRAGARR